MRLGSIGLGGMFGFDRPVHLPVGDIGPGLVAIVGDNGCGKTGLIEIVPAVNYGKLPGRDNDAPIDYANSGAAFMEYSFTTEDQRQFTARLNIDGDTRDTDGVLTEIREGRRLPTDGKVSTLRSAILALGFPSFDLFINSSFAAQGRGDQFARTKPSARKDLFAQFLALSELLAQADTAAKAADLCQTTLDRLRAVHQALSATTGPEADVALESRERMHRDNHIYAGASRTDAGAAIASLEARLATMQDAVAAFGAAQLRMQTIQSELTERLTDRAGCDTSLQILLSTRTREIKTAETAHSAAIADIDRRLAALATNTQLEATLKDIEQRLLENRKLQDQGDAIRAAADHVANAEAELARLRTVFDDQAAKGDDIAANLRAAEDAITALALIEQRHSTAERDAAVLETVPCGGVAPYDSCQFLKNATEGKHQLATLVEQLRPKAELADRVGRLRHEKTVAAQAILATRQAITEAETTKTSHQKQAALLPYLNAAADRMKELTNRREAAIADANDATERARHDLEAQRSRAGVALEQALQDADRRAASAQAEIELRKTGLDLRIQTLQTALGEARSDLTAVREEHLQASALESELAQARKRSDDALSDVTRAEAGLTEVARDREALGQHRRRLIDVDAQIAAVAGDLADWRDLQKSLGKGGLADLEIDAAGPEIARTANELLEAADCARFTMRIITQSEKVAGGMKDDFDVVVMDNTDGRGWRPLRSFSGGQRTLIQEALMLSIALYVNARSPMPIRTLWRDETGAALDAANAPRYIEMLRAVMRIGGMWQIFFITHNAQCAAMADAQIVVADGGAAIVLPPYQEAA